MSPGVHAASVSMSAAQAMARRVRIHQADGLKYISASGFSKASVFFTG